MISVNTGAFYHAKNATIFNFLQPSLRAWMRVFSRAFHRRMLQRMLYK